MATNFSIDAELLNEAHILSGLPTKKDTVNQALLEFVQRRKQHEITSLFGSLPPELIMTTQRDVNKRSYL